MVLTESVNITPLSPLSVCLLCCAYDGFLFRPEYIDVWSLHLLRVECSSDIIKIRSKFYKNRYKKIHADVTYLDVTVNKYCLPTPETC
jgi:hypothetical protein